MCEPGTTATGDCFEAAFKFVTSRGEGAPHRYTLVHGNVARLRQDRAVNHAWVEEGDVVHEVSKGPHRQFTKVEYYERLRVTNVRRYTYEDALLESLRARHYGPWDNCL